MHNIADVKIIDKNAPQGWPAAWALVTLSSGASILGRLATESGQTLSNKPGDVVLLDAVEHNVNVQIDGRGGMQIMRHGFPRSMVPDAGKMHVFGAAAVERIADMGEIAQRELLACVKQANAMREQMSASARGIHLATNGVMPMR